MLQKFLYPLRVFHGKLYELKNKFKSNIKLFNFLKFPFGKKVYIIGAPDHTNLGDSAIVVAQIDFLINNGFDEKHIKVISFKDYLNSSDFYVKYIGKKHLITHLGGGNMGNQWIKEEEFHQNLVLNFPLNPMIIFPQTIYYTNDECGNLEKQQSIKVYNIKSNLTMVARETTSFSIMSQLYPNADILLTPDIVLSTNAHTYKVSPQKRSGIKLCMRSDCERSITDEELDKLVWYINTLGLDYFITDMHSEVNITDENRFEAVSSKMSELSSSELVITDRLHGMIFCAVSGTPCIVLSNYNHKVKGTYEWIKHLPYVRYANNMNNAISLIPEMLKLGPSLFDNSNLLPHFNKLSEVIKKYV